MLSNRTGITHLAQSQNSCFHQVVRIGRSLGFSQHIFNACAFQHGTHGTASHNSRTFGSRKNQHIRTSELGSLLVGNRSFYNRNFYQIFLRSFHALRYCGGYFTGFAKTAPDHTLSITDNNDCGKGESTTTLGYLNYAIDSNQSIL